MTCGNDVFDKKQQSRIAQKIHETLVAEGKDQLSAAEVKKFLDKEDEQERKAEEYKNKLLDYDRSSAKRTRVIGQRLTNTLQSSYLNIHALTCATTREILP